MGTTAENVAKQYSLSRTEQQEFAISSHKKAFEAQTKGNFNNEIVSIGSCSQDSNIRPNSNQEKLDSLKLAFDQNGTVTAATSSPLTDGAAATLICEAKLTIKDIDIIELNEAFASQSLACIKDLQIDHNKVNIDGGALALGHPLGATGARITGKAAQLLRRENKKYALATQCIGLGMGIATIIESVD